MPSQVEQEGGDHYQTPVQHWDWAQYLGYLEGCATKYIGRHERKNGIKDIRKALTFIDKLIRKHYGFKLVWTVVALTETEECDYNVND